MNEWVPDYVLEAPFTAIVSGPTGCGKTVLIDKILQKASSLINPPPDKNIILF